MGWMHLYEETSHSYGVTTVKRGITAPGAPPGLIINSTFKQSAIHAAVLPYQ